MSRIENDVKVFTLLELLIIIAIVFILAAVLFMAINPLNYFKNGRNLKRQNDIDSILSAIKTNKINNDDQFSEFINKLTTGYVYMIGTAKSNCDSQNIYIDTDVTSSLSCIDLTILTTNGYLNSIPVSPNGNGIWTPEMTGYTLSRDLNNVIIIRAAESEGSTEITVST